MGRAAAQQQQQQKQDQHHDSKQAGAAQDDADGPTVDNWSEKDQRIIVATPSDGYLFDLQLHAKLDGSPRQVYNILTDPDSPRIFRGIKAVLSREVLEEDGAGRRKLLVGHRALTRFLWLSVAFDTHLYVWEDDVAMTIKFTNARQDGFMRRFEGAWRLHPFNQASLDALFKHPNHQQQQKQSHSSSHHAVPFWHHIGGHHHQQQQPSATLVTLEQALAPRATPPKPLQPLVRGLCGRVLHNMMADLRTELERQQAAAAEPAGHTSAAKGARSSSSHDSSSSSSKGMVLPVASLSVGSWLDALPTWEVEIKL